MTTQSNNNLLYAVLILFLMGSCGTDDDNPIPIEDATTESFSELSVTDFSQLETPFESLLNSLDPGGRVKDHEVSQDELIELLEEIFHQSLVVDSEEDTERGLTVTKFLIQLSDEAYVEFSIVSELGKILEIEGQVGPFDYDVEAGGSFVNLSQALQNALSEISGGEIERWELEIEEDNHWEFEVHVVNDEGRWEIEIDAFSGELIKIKRKNISIDEEKGFDRPGEEAPDDIKEIALSIAPGEIIHARQKVRDDESLWFIAILTESGSKVKITLNSSGDLIEVKGDEKPFEYVVEPGDDLLTFLEAKEILHNEFDGELLEWKLREYEDDNDDARWIYKFEIIQGDKIFEIKLNAATGAFVSFDRQDDDIDHLPQEIRDLISSIIEAEIVEAHLENNDRTWYIKVVTSDGSEVKIKIDRDSGELVEIKGSDSTFDYEVTPGLDLMVLSAILEVVLDTGDEELVRWRLEFNSDETWVYELIIEANDQKIKIILDAATGAILVEEITEPENDDVPSELLQQALDLIDGEVAKTEKEGGDIVYWKIKIETADGAHIYIGFDQEGNLRNIEDNEGPFDYNIEPGMDLISFAEAKEIALDTGDETLVGWELESDDTGEWFYKLKITVNNEQSIVEIDALTGEVI